MELRPELTPRAELAQHPFQLVEGIEVLENMRKQVENEEQTLEGIYISKREEIMATPFEKVVVSAALARSGVAKGSLLMGLGRVAKQDPILHEWLDQNNLELEIVAVNFALSAIAARFRGIVPPLLQGQWTAEHYNTISHFSWNLIDEHVLRIPGGKVRWLLYESAAATSYPVTQTVPVEVAGIADRGNSPLYNLALDDRTRANIDIFALRKDARVGQTTIEHRNKFNPHADNFNNVFRGDIDYRMTDDSGEEQGVWYLPLEEQRKMVALLSAATAPGPAIIRSDKELDDLEAQLYQEGLISTADDQAYFDFIGRQLKLPTTQFHQVTNNFLLGRKTYDLDYLLKDNLVIRLYPGLLEYILNTYSN